MRRSADVVSARPTREVPCYLCGRDDPRTMFRQPPYRVVRCQGCGLVYTLPRLDPEQIEAMYQTAYWHSEEAREFGYTDYLNDRELYLATYRMRREVIRSRKPEPGRVLDVGSAAGCFLATMAEIGWDCHGVELSTYMSDKSRELFGLDQIVCGSILDTDLPLGSFDAITFWDVVEHLEDPIPHLRMAHRLLKPDGLLIVETQNVESWFAKLLGRRWHHYKMAEHLYHFGPETAAKLLDRAGFVVEQNSPRRGGKQVSMNFLVERVGKIHPLLSVLASPLHLVGRFALYVNLFDEMLIVARKRPESWES